MGSGSRPGGSRTFLTRFPPGGRSYSLGEFRGAARGSDPAGAARAGLRAWLGPTQLTLHASGREALRVAFAHLAASSGRDEIWVPAYTCFSIPAAAVAAGLRVRLVEIGLDGRIEPNALAKLPLERAAALVVSNLFGIPEPVAALREIAGPRGVALVDDAAQSLGARSAEGPVGSRGDVGVLSFGRGKPLCALGGGALAWCVGDGPAEPPAPDARRVTALVRAAAFNLALRPPVFRWLAAIPALGIGETRFDPNFARGGIDGASLCLLAAALPDLEAANRQRARRAEALAARIAAETKFAPLLAPQGERAVYPRLALIAPSAAARDRALRALARIGATRMYPAPLACVKALEPHRVGEAELPGARQLADRLLTLPTERALEGERLAAALEALRTAC